MPIHSQAQNLQQVSLQKASSLSSPFSMITVWHIKADDLSLELPLVEGFQYDFLVDWGDGSAIQRVKSFDDPKARHIYKRHGHYKVVLQGLLEAWGFQKNTFRWRATDPELRHEAKLKGVLQLGRMGLKSLRGGFAHCRRLVKFNGPDIQGVQDLSYAFMQARNLNPDVSQWDTSQVTNLSYMFLNADIANPDVSQWDTSKVIRMTGLFWGAKKAKPDVSGWDVSQVTDVSYMFFKALQARPDVSRWDTSQVTDMSYMFLWAPRANPDTRAWNFQSVRQLRSIFDGATGLSVGNYAHFLMAASDPNTGLVDLKTLPQDKKSCRLRADRASVYCYEIGYIPLKLEAAELIDKTEYGPLKLRYYSKVQLARRYLAGRGWWLEDKQGLVR